MELVPTSGSDPGLMREFAEFAENILGKGVVWAKDTPNFIANRIGVFSGCLTYRLMVELGLSIEDVDLITGPLIGRPKTASFRPADLVGLDVFSHVANNINNSCMNDERRDLFELPGWFGQMLEAKRYGNKTGEGFYKKTRNPDGERQILVWDFEKQNYRKPKKTCFLSVGDAKRLSLAAERIRVMFYASDQAGQFIFKLLTETLIYAANRIPEISRDLVNIDNAMKWGFNWALGPFEIWDALDFQKSCRAMRKAGYALPASIEQMLASEHSSFYRQKNGRTLYYDFDSQKYKHLSLSPYIILLPALKENERTIISNKAASLIDLEDGVACLEFHSKMNAFGAETISLMEQSCERVESDFQGMVIANHGENFSVGANLAMILFAAREGEWDQLEFMVRKFQQSMQDIKYLKLPVVSAPHSLAIGGGCELIMHSACVVAAAETYTGMVETGSGLIPAGEGSKELLLRNTHERVFKVSKGGIYPGQINLLPFVARAYETIALAKVSTSAHEAKKLGI